MRCIQVVIDHMDDTLEEAHEYYRDYIIYKDSQPQLANTALEMAKTHMGLYLKWHDVVVNLINEYKSKNGEAPKEMIEMWNYYHQKLSEEYNELKYKINNSNL